MKTLLYFFPVNSPFIEKDIAFLQKSYRVKTPKHTWLKKSAIPITFIKQFFFLIRYCYSCHAIFVMFAGYWSFLPALFGKIMKKKVLIILGGTDCVAIPSVHYGSFRKPLLSYFISVSCHLCSQIIAVDKSLILSKNTYYNSEKNPNQGIKYYIPTLKTPIKVIHNGFNADFFEWKNTKKKPNTFVVVANINNKMRFKLKGIDLVLQMAKEYPQCHFTIIGIAESLAVGFSDNVALHPFMQQKDFLSILHNTEFVLQLSISEGFPNALCEAILCGCIPVGSHVGAIPHIIGDSGFIIHHRDLDEIRAAFDNILRLSPQQKLALSTQARNRIYTHFPISKREKQFMELLQE